MINSLISSFNAGELSPYLENRTNLDKYRNGCLVMENFIPTSYGPTYRRPGTQYLGAAGSNTTRGRLFGLNFSDSDHLVMEIGDGYINFWRNDANGNAYKVTTASAQPVDYTGASFTPGAGFWYTESELRDISILPINRVIYMNHPNHPPMRLSYYSDTNVTFGEVPFKYAPMTDVNVTSTTVTPSGINGSITTTAMSVSGTTVTATLANHPLVVGAVITITGSSSANLNGTWSITAVTATTFQFSTTVTATAVNATGIKYLKPVAGTTVTLTSSSAIFNANHVGAYWQLSHFNPSSFISISLKADATSSAIYVNGSYTLNTFGTWDATVLLQQKGDDGVWYTIKTLDSTLDYNAAYTGITASGVFLRMVITGSNATGASTSPRAILTPLDGLIYGQVRITGYNSPTSVTGTITQAFGDIIPTGMWYEGAFSRVNGYPACVGLFEGRVIYGGTSKQPNTIWGSASADFQQFLLGSNIGDSISFTLSSTSSGKIRWMIGKSALIVGTSTDEWAISSGDGSPLSASNVVAKLQSRYGSTSVPPLVVNETLLFFQRGAKKIREMSYSWQVDAWVSPDLSVMAEQATRTGIIERAYVRVPDGSLWLITGDNNLVNVLYDRDQQVSSFSRHITDGKVESITSINGTSGEDEAWMIVNRTINGTTKRYIERLRTGVRYAVENADKSGWWFSDCSKIVTPSSPTNVLTGLDHLEGKEVQVWGTSSYTNAGQTVTTYAVTAVIPNPSTGLTKVQGGTIYLNENVSSAIVGLAYTSRLAPTRCDQDLNDGTSVGRRSRIPKMKVRVMNSIGGEYSSDNTTWNPMVARSMFDKMDDSPAPINNNFEVLTVSGNWTYLPTIYLRQNLPLPFTVCSMVIIWETSENLGN